MGALALRAVAAAGWLAAGAAAHAHEPEPASAATGWTPEAWVLWLLALAAALYLAGLARLWRNAGTGRGLGRSQALSFALGWLALAAALASPLDALGTRLFAAHMVQHELLMVVAAPLLVLGRPLVAWTWALTPRQRRRVGRAAQAPWFAPAWRFTTRAPTAWALHASALWAWHLPALFEAALRIEAVHIAQHASFLATALLFWWSVLGGDPRAQRSAAAIGSLLTTMMHTGALGALLTFAPTVWYRHYGHAGGAFGLAPLEDQQLGGLIMWVPGGLAYLVAGLALLARLLSATTERESREGFAEAAKEQPGI